MLYVAGFLVVVILYWILKELQNHGDMMHNQHNAWQKEHGRELGKNGFYEDREVIRERIRREDEQEEMIP